MFVSKAAGELLADKAVNGQGTLTVQPADDMIVTSSALAGQMSDFSSWGVTPDLQLVPDITAPGGNIYSTRDSGTYGTMSGTSMSAPHITGMSALVLQYLRDKYDLTDAQAHTVAEALLMSTAEPMAEPSGTLYSPEAGRRYGQRVSSHHQPRLPDRAGRHPKVSFGDDDDRTGVYRFSFEIHNLTDEVQTYALDGSAMTDQVDLAYADYGYYFMGETSRNLEAAVTFDTKTGDLPIQYDYNGDGVTDLADVQALLDAVNGLSDVKNGYDLNNDGKTNTADVQKLYELVQDGFTAPGCGGGSRQRRAATVYVTVALSGNDKAYMDAYYENGIYVDGFIRLYAQGGNTVDLGLPFMGFYGDWATPASLTPAGIMRTIPSSTGISM